MVFVNTVYFGHYSGIEVTGFARAAEFYFGKSFHQLSRDEYLSLVAMIIGPNSYNVVTHPKANTERVERIKKLVNGEYKPKGLMDLYYDK